jgi:hypothetical protein
MIEYVWVWWVWGEPCAAEVGHEFKTWATAAASMCQKRLTSETRVCWSAQLLLTVTERDSGTQPSSSCWAGAGARKRMHASPEFAVSCAMP